MDPKHAQVLDKYTSECDEDEDEKIRETSMQYMGRELWYRMQNLILAVHDKNAKGPYNPKPVMHAEDLLANDDFFLTGSVMSRKLLRLVVNIARDKPVPQERDIKDNLELMKNTREFLEKEKAEELERKREEKRRKEAEEESLKASTSKEEPVPGTSGTVEGASGGQIDDESDTLVQLMEAMKTFKEEPIPSTSGSVEGASGRQIDDESDTLEQQMQEVKTFEEKEPIPGTSGSVEDKARKTKVIRWSRSEEMKTSKEPFQFPPK